MLCVCGCNHGMVCVCGGVSLRRYGIAVLRRCGVTVDVYCVVGVRV